MDNVTHAMFLAFAMLALVIGLSFSIYLINQMNIVSTLVINSNDKTRDYQTVSYNSSNLRKNVKLDVYTGDKNELFKKRIVSVDTVISTIYRYYKENFSVEIYDKSGNLNQVFDLRTENIVGGSSSVSDFIRNGYLARFDNTTDVKYMFNVPWRSDVNLIKKRIDLYIASKSGYIDRTFVDYKSNNRGLNNLITTGGSNFTEEFIQYSYDGDVYTVENGEDTESITGNIQEKKKIIIRYKQI